MEEELKQLAEMIKNNLDVHNLHFAEAAKNLAHGSQQAAHMSVGAARNAVTEMVLAAYRMGVKTSGDKDSERVVIEMLMGFKDGRL